MNEPGVKQLFASKNSVWLEKRFFFHLQPLFSYTKISTHSNMVDISPASYNYQTLYFLKACSMHIYLIHISVNNS